MGHYYGLAHEEERYEGCPISMMSQGADKFNCGYFSPQTDDYIGINNVR
jgi:hypothetical protein